MQNESHAFTRAFILGFIAMAPETHMLAVFTTLHRFQYATRRRLYDWNDVYHFDHTAAPTANSFTICNQPVAGWVSLGTFGSQCAPTHSVLYGHSRITTPTLQSRTTRSSNPRFPHKPACSPPAYRIGVNVSGRAKPDGWRHKGIH